MDNTKLQEWSRDEIHAIIQQYLVQYLGVNIEVSVGSKDLISGQRVFVDYELYLGNTTIYSGHTSDLISGL